MHINRVAHSKNSNRVLFLALYLFLCVFAPPVLPDINLVLVLAFFSIPYLMANGSISRCVMATRSAKSFRAWFMAYVAYWLVVTFVNVLFGGESYVSDYITSAYSFFLVVPICFICAVTVLVFKIKHGLSDAQIIKSFIVAGLVQSAITFAAFVDPGVKDLLTDIMFQNTGTSQMQEGSWIAERRFYGFANSMLDLYGFGTGVIAALPAFLVLINRQVSKAWLLAIPFLLVVPALNARTGLVLFVVAIIIASLCAGRMSGLSIVATMLTTIMVALIALALVYVISIVRPEVIDWLLGDLLGTTQHNTFSVLFGEKFWELPDPLMVLTGTGHSVYGVPGFSHSDVGYVNELWRSGVIGLVFLLGAFVRPVVVVWRGLRSNIALNYLVVAVLVCFGVVAIKCMPITHSGGMIILITLILLCGLICEQSKGGDACDAAKASERNCSNI